MASASVDDESNTAINDGKIYKYTDYTYSPSGQYLVIIYRDTAYTSKLTVLDLFNACVLFVVEKLSYLYQLYQITNTSICIVKTIIYGGKAYHQILPNGDIVSFHKSFEDHYGAITIFDDTFTYYIHYITSEYSSEIIDTNIPNATSHIHDINANIDIRIINPNCIICIVSTATATHTSAIYEIFCIKDNKKYEISNDSRTPNLTYNSDDIFITYHTVKDTHYSRSTVKVNVVDMSTTELQDEAISYITPSSLEYDSTLYENVSFRIGHNLGVVTHDINNNICINYFRRKYRKVKAAIPNFD